MTVRILFPAAVAVVFAIHLKDSWVDDFPRRVRTKPLLVPLILAWYLVCAGSPDWILAAALFAAWVGDLLLMPSGDRWFVAGGIAFLAAHVLFILVFIPRILLSAVRWGLLLPAALVYLAVAALVIRRVWKDTPKLMRGPMAAYLAANMTMNLCALARWMSCPCTGSVLAWCGAVLFFASDCLLFLVEYGGCAEKLRHYFYVMLTYVPGVFLIALGILLS